VAEVIYPFDANSPHATTAVFRLPAVWDRVCRPRKTTTVFLWHRCTDERDHQRRADWTVLYRVTWRRHV